MASGLLNTSPPLQSTTPLTTIPVPVLACEYEDGSELLYSKNQTQCIAQGDYLVTKSNETAKAATLTYTWLFIDRVEVAIVEK